MKLASRNGPAPSRVLRGRWTRIAFYVSAIVVFSGFLMLGNWQLRRLHWKRQLIHDVAARVHAPPVAAPGPAQWRGVTSGDVQYLHVKVRGTFLRLEPTLVHGTAEPGYGFWVMAPLRTDRGFIVLVNRGFIPADLPGTPAFAVAQPPTSEISVTGLLRSSETGGGFLRANQPTEKRWYSRDVAAIGSALSLSSTQLAPYFIDADKLSVDSAEGKPHWPLAGQTVIKFPNHHLGYLITWYLMALGVAGAVVYVDWVERRRARHRS